MKIVKNKDYYHIQRFDCPHKWNVGNTFSFGNQNNHYANRFNNPGFVYATETGEKIQILQSFYRIKSLLNTGNVSGIDLRKIVELIKVLRRFADDTLIVHRENVFEEIRAKNFPNLPSRKRCIWLIPFNKESLDFWVPRIPKRKIFQINATGKVHNSSERFLLFEEYNSLEDIRQAAFSYWAGVEGESKDDEIIFEGVIEVIQEIK